MIEIMIENIDRWKDIRDPNRESKKKSFENAIDQYIAEMGEQEERTTHNRIYQAASSTTPKSAKADF